VKVAMHADGPSIRGSERQALLIAEGLRARGHEVVVSCRAGGPVQAELERAGVRTARVRPRGDADVLSLLAFAAWLRRERPDALLLTSWVRLFGASWAARLARTPRVVLRLGGEQRVPARGASGWKYRRALRAGVDVVVVNSRELRERLLAQLPGFDPGRVRVVHNAVEPVRAEPAALRAEVGAIAGEALVLGVGGLERRKGFDVLVEALAAAPGGLRLAIAGSGPDREALRAQAERLGIGGRVHLLGQRSDVPALLAAADVFVLSSRSDSMANAMLEAMAAGTPVVATRVPGTEDALAPRDGRPAAGWIVPPGDAGALAAALAAVTADLRAGGGKARAHAREARWRLEHWFTRERMVGGYEAVLAGGAP
jgi:glycosyltransferase involved in cell wall biosynthesis